jgi:hypothetical protein
MRKKGELATNDELSVHSIQTPIMFVFKILYFYQRTTLISYNKILTYYVLLFNLSSCSVLQSIYNGYKVTVMNVLRRSVFKTVAMAVKKAYVGFNH